MEYVPDMVYTWASSQEIWREPVGTSLLAIRNYANYFGLGSNDFKYRWAHEIQNSLQSCATEFLNRQLGIKLFPYTHKIQLTKL